MDSRLIVVIILSELISLFLIVRVLKSPMGFTSKMLVSTMLLVPIIGPVMYGLGVEVPPPNKDEFQKLNRNDHPLRHRRFQNDFEMEALKAKNKIKHAKGK